MAAHPLDFSRLSQWVSCKWEQSPSMLIFSIDTERQTKIHNIVFNKFNSIRRNRLIELYKDKFTVPDKSNHRVQGLEPILYKPTQFISPSQILRQNHRIWSLGIHDVSLDIHRLLTLVTCLYNCHSSFLMFPMISLTCSPCTALSYNLSVWCSAWFSIVYGFQLESQYFS